MNPWMLWLITFAGFPLLFLCDYEIIVTRPDGALQTQSARIVRTPTTMILTIP